MKSEIVVRTTNHEKLCDVDVADIFLQSFPCIYLMLSERDQDAYKHAFEIIEEEWQLQMSKTWIDYDSALRNALINIYPAVDMNAHWNQFCYAMRRKCKLIDQFYESVYLSNASHLFHQVLCIPLLPENLIVDAEEIMKRKSVIFPPLDQMLHIFKELKAHEGVKKICVDWNWFGEKCTQNYNEILKNKNSASSLFCLLQIMKTEQNKMNVDYGREEAMYQANQSMTVHRSQ